MKRTLTGLALVLLVPALIVAQAKGSPAGGQKLTLEFVDGGTNLTVTTPDNTQLSLGTGINEGDVIPVGSTVVTGSDTMAELKLSPNGSIIKLARSTSFTVASLASTAKDKNVFANVAGKVRAVAAKGGLYEFRSQTTVAGVRGTDFVFDVDETAQKALLMVNKGLIQFDRLDATGAVVASVPVAAGMAADAFAATFQAFKFSPDQFAQEYGDLPFKKLNENDVPGQAPEQPSTSEKGSEGQGTKQGAESPFMKWLRDYFGIEIGAVTIDGVGYSKLIASPTFDFGKAKLGLYLPVIYTSDIFSPSDWYRPAGNNEWSFGAEYWGKDNLKGAEDFGRDLALKIRYFEYGKQFEDPFFVKLGNLEDLTLGHGLIMRNYANDTEFPAVRRVGLNTGYDGGGAGLEAIVNDLADPQIFGARLYVRPIPNFKLALGASAVLDKSPAEDLSDADSIGNPMLMSGGLDLDLPVIESEIFRIRWYADGAATAPYLQTPAGGLQSGLQYKLIYENNQVKNWGADSGFMGNILFIDYRLEFRYFTGIFQGSLYDSTYDRNRAYYAQEYFNYAQNPSAANAPTVMGIYGEGGFNILNKKLSLILGYMYPWSPNGTLDPANYPSNADEFHAKLVVRKGLIPILDLSGSISYDRRNFANSIANGSFSLLDADSTFSGEIVLPVPNTPNLDLAIVFATVPVRGADGNIVYTSTPGVPEIQPSISIETRIHF